MDDPEARAEARSHLLRLLVAALGILALVTAGVLAICLLVYSLLHPHDEVMVTVRNIPADAERIFLVASTPGGPAAMDWYVRTLVAGAMRPADCTVSYSLPGTEDNHIRHSVRWVQSERVGVVLWTRARGWSVAWFDPPKSDLRAQPGLFSPGEWEGDLADADAREPLTRQQMKQLWVEEEEAR